MNSKLFIDTIRKRKTTFPAPEEAIDKANACNALSRDIYTDNTRFIYELLQNADDASCKSGSLTFNLEFIGDYLVVSHKGNPFDENDVESICSIGDGSKAADVEQTGFKGIGFKSVFAYSDTVIIKSGDFCFKFDKEESNNYWDDKWGNKNSWQQMRKGKGKTDKVSMPWQIIPNNTDIPQIIPAEKISEYTVSTIIKCKKVAELKESVQKLFSSSQLILFLRSKNVNVIVNTGSLLQIEKKTTNDITTISKNGEVISRWLMHTTIPFDVPSHIREQMEEDKDHYPEKLREATKASISFAISLENGKIEKLDNETNNIYSFLPTTVYSYDLPFIVNSNFITNAGRQNLHQDYVWNQWLFEELPNHYLKWIAQIAKDGKYGLDFLKVIAKKSGSYDELGKAYDRGMLEALSNTAILPNNDVLLKVKDAVFDKTTISAHIDANQVLSYLESKNHHFESNGLLNRGYMPFCAKIKSLGVYIFEEEELKNMIASQNFIDSQDAEQNAQLITFLSNRYDLSENKDETILWLQSTPFILAESGRMFSPQQLCFPSITNTDNNEVETISNSIYESLHANVITWLRNIGVQDVSDTSIIDTGKLFEEGFITTDNAIEICRTIYGLHVNAKLNEDQYLQLRELKLITTLGSLQIASDTYLCGEYNPALNIEPFYHKDWYVSFNYANGLSRQEKRDLLVFFEKIGVSQNVEIESPSIHLVEESQRETTNEYRKEYCKITISELTNEHPNEWAWYRAYTEFNSIRILDEAIDNYDISKIIWSAIFDNSQINPSELFDDFVVWKWFGFHKKSYTSWLVETQKLIPTTLHYCLIASDVYSNSILHIYDLAHDILPIIDYHSPLSEEWKNKLHLKEQLYIEDYISLLSIYPNLNLDYDDVRNRINIMYGIICELLPTLNYEQKSKLENYGGNMYKLLAKDNNFYYPSELSYITIPGFNAQKEIYAENVDDNMLELFRLFGVTVIDKFETKIIDEIPEDNLKKRLFENAPLLAILSIKDRSFIDEVNKIKDRISELSIKHASSIQLTYGDNNDVQERTTFYNSDEKCFYFTGDWEKPRIILNLVEPLCEILHIKKSYSKILSVILSEPNFIDNKKYLEENGFDVSCITEDLELVETTTFKGLTAREEIELINSDIQDGNLPSDGVGGNRKVSYAVEAQQRIMDILKKNNCTFEDSGHSYTVLYSVKRPDGTTSKAVMKSAKGGYIYFTPREWLELASDNAMLLLVDRNNQVRNVRLEELEESNDHFHMRFDTRDFAVKSNLRVFAEFFRPMPQGSVYFVFGVPYSLSKADYLEEFGLDKQNTSAIELTNDDVNMLAE